jgi:hypothetical protein
VNRRPGEVRRAPRVGGRGSRWRAGFGVLSLLMLSLACLIPDQPDWDARVKTDEVDLACENLPPHARSALMPLSKVFYGRITSRRFNSRATFEDPSVRQFFPTVAAYSDYYAALVDALDRANIENNRPTVVELLSIGRNESGSLRITVRFIGSNDLPLRWWSASLVREDEWLWREDRWWVVPGKV